MSGSPTWDPDTLDKDATNPVGTRLNFEWNVGSKEVKLVI